MVNKATFGVLSIYMTFFISYSYIKIKADPEASFIGAASSSVISFFILAGVDLADFSTDRTGPKSMFLAILTGLGATALYFVFEKLLKNTRKHVLTAGADKEFNLLLSVSNLAAFLGMEIIAEYVEKEEQKEVLHELGCNCYQGYLYSPAVFLDNKYDVHDKKKR